MLQKQIDKLMKLNSKKNKKLGIKNQKQYGRRPGTELMVFKLTKGKQEKVFS